MIRNGMGSLPIIGVHPGTENKLLVEAIGLNLTTHWVIVNICIHIGKTRIPRK